MSPAPESKNFDIGHLFGRSWELFMKNAAAFVGAMVVTLLLLVVAQYAVTRVAASLGSVVALVLAGPFLLGMYKMALQAVRGQAVQLGTLFEGFNQFIHAFLANVLISIFASIGFVLCIVPGFLVFALYLNTYLFLAREGGNFWDAMEKSRKFEMDNLMPWLILGVVIIFCNCAGAALCGFGLLVSVPVTTLMVVLAHDLQRDAGRVTLVEPTEDV